MAVVPVPLTSDEEAALVAQAKAQGVSVDFLLRQAILRIISPPHSPELFTLERREVEFGEWLDSLPNLPPLSDEAISRESIYTREDEWR